MQNNALRTLFVFVFLKQRNLHLVPTHTQQRDLKVRSNLHQIRMKSFDTKDAELTVAPLIQKSQHLLQPNGSISGRQVAQEILPHFPDLLSALPLGVHKPALASTDGRKPITTDQINECITTSGNVFKSLGVGRGHRIAVVLPNGPELALAILVTSTWASCVPLNAFGAEQELEADLFTSGADLIIGLRESDLSQKLSEKLKIPFIGLFPDTKWAGLFRLEAPSCRLSGPPHRCKDKFGLQAREYDYDSDKRFQANQHNDEVLILFTSGTTGSKKLVPHLLADVVVATTCISLSWKLTPHDTNCNLMPLFHVGGIIRQVFSPIFSGGCVICCPSFDPGLFWQILLQDGAPSFTWYYAAPTMHQLILQTGVTEGYLVDGAVSPKKLRMIANAAGGLLPSLARQLRNAFGANVLPSYGMTECMPITSPPADYQLEKPGTSGVAVGPELAILDLKTQRPLAAGKEGPICVRSEPLFRGYGALQSCPSEKIVSFLPGGWFNTGDLGYMDADGYLYITGRAKEVINRGGEIISPIEVEEAINGHPLVAACVAFSAKHSLLQEVVGLVMVPYPNKPRLDLPALHKYLGDGRLAAPKWPQCVVYMDTLPKSHTNKILRVKLGQRLSLPELHDSMLPIERTFKATCPPLGTSVLVAIPCAQVSVNAQDVQQTLRDALLKGEHQDLVVVPHPTKYGALVAHVYNLDPPTVVRVAQDLIDGYAVPSHVCKLNEPVASAELNPPQPSDAIVSILQEESNSGHGPTDSLVSELQELFQMLLDLDCLPAPDSNFFNTGGSSMLASQLASRIRKMYDIPFGGAEVFHHPTCLTISDVIRERRGEAITNPQSRSTTDPASIAASSQFSKDLNLSRASFDPSRIEPSNTFFSASFQLLPITVLYPVWYLTRFFLFFRCLLWILLFVPGERNLYKIIFTLVFFHFFWVTVTPWIFVLIKWSIIGRYKAGRYGIWGSYYLRWWIVEIFRKMIGRGIWGSNAAMLNFYYRALGAKIGKNARISSAADVAEYDLVTIGDEAAIEYSTVRAFGVDNGCVILGPVRVGNQASVGIRSVVAPNTEVPDGRHLGPATSSYEISASPDSDNLRYNREALPEPYLTSQIFLIWPIKFFVTTISHIPAFAILYWMITMPWHHDEPFDTMNDLMEWLCDVRRIPFFIGIRVVRAIVAPLVYMICAILVKRFIIGKFRPGPRDPTSEWEVVRHHLAANIFTRESMQDCTEILGRHYELVSILYRLLGAKIGKRVFWPGHQPIFTGEFDLLEIGDDVVFGSRSCLLSTTTDSCEKIVLCAGANVSDNTVVLPGGIIGKNAVLGSNSVCPAGRYLPEQSVWFGSRCGEPVLLEKGLEASSHVVNSCDVKPSTLQFHGDETTLRPFGRAVYNNEAPYCVWPTWMIILFTIVTRVANAALHTM